MTPKDRAVAEYERRKRASTVPLGGLPIDIAAALDELEPRFDGRERSVEGLVQLALALSPFVEHYDWSKAPADEARAHTAAADRGDIAKLDSIVAARRRVQSLRHGADGGPPAWGSIAHAPVVERWCRDVERLAEVADPELSLSGLRARLWLRYFDADRQRQIGAAAALGLDWSELVGDEEARDERTPLLAVVRLLTRRGSTTGWDDAKALWAGADRPSRLRLSAFNDRVLATADVRYEEVAMTFIGREYVPRPWVWPWEEIPGSGQLPPPPALPVVYPSDWRDEWSDRHGWGERRTPGEVLVIGVDEVAARRESMQPAWYHRAVRPVSLMPPVLDPEPAEVAPVIDMQTRERIPTYADPEAMRAYLRGDLGGSS